MGTNYYHISDTETEHCHECGNAGPKRRHIGKSSAGWCFALHIIPECGISTLYDWRRVWQSGRIVDEYGDEIHPDEMLLRITERGSAYPPSMSAREMAQNNAELGPRNLLRHRIGPYCVAHGDGTWDYMIGRFS